MRRMPWARASALALLEPAAGAPDPAGQVAGVAQAAEGRDLVAGGVGRAGVGQRALVGALTARQIAGGEQQVATQVLERGPGGVIVGGGEGVGLGQARQRLLEAVQQAQRRRHPQAGAHLLLGGARLASRPGEHGVRASGVAPLAADIAAQADRLERLRRLGRTGVHPGEHRLGQVEAPLAQGLAGDRQIGAGGAPIPGPLQVIGAGERLARGEPVGGAAVQLGQRRPLQRRADGRRHRDRGRWRGASRPAAASPAAPARRARRRPAPAGCAICSSVNGSASTAAASSSRRSAGETRPSRASTAACTDCGTASPAGALSSSCTRNSG